MPVYKLLLLTLMVILPAAATAGVYKYQDENGKWHFTDTPPANDQSTSVTSVTASGANQRDLKQELEDQFKPDNDVDRATLSVVTVKTAGGNGSGFFITDQGHVVTNRHVVRPATSSQARDNQAKLEHYAQQLETARLQLEYEENRLEEMRQTIEEERPYVESGSVSSSYRAQFNRYVKRYELDRELYERDMKKFREVEGKYRKAKSDIGFSNSLTNFSKKFTLVLKNGRKIKAKLVKISKNYDLALLKVENVLVQPLSFSTGGRPQQGVKVFAVGSPLGISDALTTGIITKSAKDFLYTDTRILPGNSGGPLIDSKGKLIGVNTAVVTGGGLAEGLGVVIYAKHIRSEFARELRGNLKY